MANLPFDREIINALERPLSSDINVAQSQLDYTIRWLFQQMYAPSTSWADPSPTWRDGFIGNGFRLVPAGAMVLTLKAGMGAFSASGDVVTNIDSIIGLDDRCVLKPLVLTTDQSITVPNADPVLDRYDILEVKYERSTENPTARDILNTTTGTFVSNVVDKTLAFALDGKTSVNGAQSINYKTGVAGAGVPPATTAGYTRIAIVYVPAAVGALTAAHLNDQRWLLAPSGVQRVTVRCAIDAGGLASTGSACLPPGMRGTFIRDTAGAYSLYIDPGAVPTGAIWVQATKSMVAPIVGKLIEVTATSGLVTPGPADLILLAGATPAMALPSKQIISVLLTGVYQVAGVTTDGFPANNCSFDVDVAWKL